jgi:hypothetical protein
VIGRIERLVFDAYRPTANGLAWYRIVYASVLLMFLIPRFTWTTTLPGSFFSPPFGPMRLLSSVPPRGVLIALQILVIVAMTAILVGWRTVAASWTMAIAWIFGAGVTFSFGKIDHILVPIIAAPLLSLAGWGSVRSLDAKAGRSNPVRGWPVALFAWLLALMMLSAALPKLRTGYLSPSTQVIQGVMFRQFHVFGRTELLASNALEVHSRVLWEAVDWSIVLLEAAFIIAWLSPRTMRLACAAATFFHLGVLLTANIPFTGNVLAYGVFFALLVPERAEQRELPAWTPAAAIGIAVVTIAAFHWRYPPGVLLVDLVSTRPGVVLSVALIGAGAVLAVVYLVRSALTLRRSISAA